MKNYLKLLLVITLVICSCGSPKGIPNRIYSTPDKPRVDTNLVRVKKANLAYANNDIDIPKFNDLISDIDNNQKINHKIKEHTKEKLNTIRENVTKKTNELKAIGKRLVLLSEKLNPDILKKRTDSLYAIKTKGKKRISEKETERIVDEVINSNKKYIEKINNQILEANEEQKTIVMTLKTYAYMLIVIKENQKDLKNIYLRIEHTNYFESGKAELNDKNLTETLTDLEQVLKSMTSALENLKLKHNFPDGLQAKIYFHIDGYTDSTPFRDNSFERNKVLSQDRADYIAVKLLNLTNSYLSNYKIVGITFLEPEITAIGHGQELPSEKENYKDNGKDDQSRRTIKVSWSFDIE